MKKILLLLAIACFCLSCEDDDITENNVSVEGNWKLTAFTLDEPVDFDNNGTLSTNLISESGCYNNSNLVFATGGLATVAIQGFEAVLEEEGGTTISTTCEAAIPETSIYTVTESAVILDGGTEDEVVLQRSGNTLTVYFPEVTGVPSEEDGGVIYTYVGATLTFTKQ